MLPGRRLLYFTLFLALVGLFNYWTRKNMVWSYAEMRSYDRLYSVREQLRILQVERPAVDSLLLRFAGGSIRGRDHYEVSVRGRKLVDQWGGFLSYKPMPELETYRIRINGRDSFDFNAELPKDGGPPEISEAALVIHDGTPPGVRDWVWDNYMGAAEDHSGWVEQFLRDSMRVVPTDPDTLKVIRIARYLLAVTAGRYGTPDQRLGNLSPIGQLEYIRSGRSLLYCGNFGNLFAYFANKAGVPTRYIESGLMENGVVNGEHIFNEVYLKGRQCWAYTDLTDGNVFVRKNGQYLNAVDVQRLLLYRGSDPGFVALHYQHDSLVEVPFRESSFFARTCFNRSNYFYFYYRNYQRLAAPAGWKDRLRSLVDPWPFYAVYSDNADIPNHRFWLRLLSGYLLLAGGFLWVIFALRLLLKGISGRSPALVTAGFHTSAE